MPCISHIRSTSGWLHFGALTTSATSLVHSVHTETMAEGFNLRRPESQSLKMRIKDPRPSIEDRNPARIRPSPAFCVGGSLEISVPSGQVGSKGFSLPRKLGVDR